ncbi:1-phosphatidylinositol phosphodiesterase-related family protein [Dorcoceras hygrometricum]|uniref:1-phosphatidylinositol phosphodiesterase-related family protein n=1 Tax=Dorcoceras hygrometricum TaxID=472368 RepID=A0A2Z7C3N3_9LAMI|nr:1-phosphatidylinositol phosphodiesterase-related family protein [Dorcoceras hygrometricum]
MGAEISKQIERRKAIAREKKILADMLSGQGSEFPGSDYVPPDRANWMSFLNPDEIKINQIVWPGTHDSATNDIGIPLLTRPLAKCQSLSVYQQLRIGARVLDIRVQQDRLVCHGILVSYSVDVVFDDIKRFLNETCFEIMILEMRTEFGHKDPPDMAEYIEQQLGNYLIPQDDQVFSKTISELLPGRVICVWKPREAKAAGSRLWSSCYLTDDWTDTDLPWTKFETNIKYLRMQQPVVERRHFYRVENTATPQPDNPIVCVKPVTDRIHPYSRLFMSQCFVRGLVDRLQIFSTDFIDEDFVDACVGLTTARVQGKA